MGGPAKKCPEGVPSWVMTFGDMNTLLLTFFVFLITTMTVDIKKFNLVLSAFQGAVGVLEQGRTINLTREELMNMGQKPERLGQSDEIIRPRQEVQQILGWISQNMERQEVHAQVTERGMKILITDKAIFDRGSDVLKPEATALLGKIGVFLRQIVPEDEFRIEGHTDDVAAEGSPLRSNIQLSAARAASVYRYLENDGIDRKRMSIAGYGEMRPLERFEGEDTESWRARNRRIEIAVMWKEKTSGGNE